MNCYRKTIDKVANDVKLKMQLGALNLKISENNYKIDDLILFDKDIEKDVYSNTTKIDTYIKGLNLINTNTTNNSNDISNNLAKINEIKDDLDNINLKNSNIKSFYNLDKIFIDDIEKNDKIVNKNNYFHIFKKEITHNFIKDSYLEIILKLLTVVSNYVLIGYFQISCNFYNENDELFYTISLSTAAGSINKLSTIKSVFIAPINKNMNKIKMDFFIMSIKGQENRSAQVIIHDINSNKIYVKYYQKTDEMSIKNIQDSLNTVNNISSDISNNSSEIDYLKNNMSKSFLRNIYNISFYNEKTKVDLSEIFYEKIFAIDAKQNDFIEINLKMLLEYENTNEKNYVSIIYQILDENNISLYFSQVNNNDYQYFSNKLSINENIFIILLRMLKNNI